MRFTKEQVRIMRNGELEDTLADSLEAEIFTGKSCFTDEELELLEDEMDRRWEDGSYCGGTWAQLGMFLET